MKIGATLDSAENVGSIRHPLWRSAEQLAAESKVCDNCGAPSAAIGTGRIVSPLFASPYFHAPVLSPADPDLRRRLEGERKQVTYFSRHEGSTEHIADRDPEMRVGFSIRS